MVRQGEKEDQNHDLQAIGSVGGAPQRTLRGSRGEMIKNTRSENAQTSEKAS